MNIETPFRALAPVSRYGFAVGVLVLLAGLVRTGWIVSGGETRILANTPDDAFYYFVLARNYAETGFWSFDGVATATGFHLAWGYVLAALYRFSPDTGLSGVFIFSGIIGSACSAVAAAALSALTRNPLAVLFVMVGQSYILLPTMAMEAPLVMAAAAVSALLVIRDRQPALAFIFGMFGELSRSDFGLVPFALLAAMLIVSRSLEAKRSAIACCAGALVGLAINLAHNYALSGQLLQNSVMMKAFWSSLFGHSFLPPLATLGDTFLLGAGLLGLVPVAISAIGSALSFRSDRAAMEMWLGSVLIVLGYVSLYSRNSQEMQFWYFSSFLIPSVVFLAGTINLLRRSLPLSSIGATLAFVSGPNVWTSLQPLWPWQVQAAEAGKMLAARQLQVGSWNAGIVGFYNRGRTVNLDGLVNDDILPHAKAGTLADYVGSRGITVIADWDVMLSRAYALRGGYADGKLASCLVPTEPIASDSPGWRNARYRIWRIDCQSPARREPSQHENIWLE